MRSMTPGAPKVRSVSARAGQVSGGGTAQEIRWLWRKGHVIAPSRPDEVPLRFEHVIHERPYRPSVTYRRSVKVCNGASYLCPSPFACVPVQIQKIEAHSVLLSFQSFFIPLRRDIVPSTFRTAAGRESAFGGKAQPRTHLLSVQAATLFQGPIKIGRRESRQFRMRREPRQSPAADSVANGGQLR